MLTRKEREVEVAKTLAELKAYNEEQEPKRDITLKLSKKEAADLIGIIAIFETLDPMTSANVMMMKVSVNDIGPMAISDMLCANVDGFLTVEENSKKYIEADIEDENAED